MSDYFPPSAFYFQVEIKGQPGSQCSFQEVSGIEVETEVEEIAEGGENNYKHRVPGRTKYPNLVLKRGLFVGGSKMAKWVEGTLQSNVGNNKAGNKIAPKDITVSLLDPKTKDALMQWNFKRAYPIKWSVGGFNSQDNSIAVETIEFAYTEWNFKKT